MAEMARYAEKLRKLSDLEDSSDLMEMNLAKLFAMTGAQLLQVFERPDWQPLFIRFARNLQLPTPPNIIL